METKLKPTPAASEKRHWIRLTRVCNQRCLFCLDRGAQNGSSLPFEVLKRNLARGRKQGMTRVVLSGGEPTIHPMFLELIGAAQALGYTHIQTITNGRRFCYPAFLDAAVAAGLREVTFSLHGNNPALHDRLTRVPGSFVQLVTALRRALSIRGLIVSVDVVINRLNLPVLREILDFCVGLGVREFDLLALVPFGDAWRHKDELFCDFAEAENRAHLRRALELSKRGDVTLWTNRLRPDCLEGFEALIQPPEKIWDEARGRRRIFARYLNGGKDLGCRGESCPQCFLKDFCADLNVLIKDKELPAKKGPLCLGPSEKAGPFRFGPKPNIFAFSDFFIEHRFFAKGAACAACARGGRCDGISVKAVRETGFAALRPEGA